MGQRLNIEILKCERVLANAYYHWSGYTSSSLSLTKLVMDNIDEINKDDDEIITAVRLLEMTGARLTKEELESSNLKINFETCEDRSQGLIAVSKKGIRETRQWEEGRVEIDLDSKTINFNCIWSSSKEEFDDDTPYDDIPVIDDEFDFSVIPFDKIDDIITLIKKTMESNSFNFRFKDSECIYTFIE